MPKAPARAADRAPSASSSAPLSALSSAQLTVIASLCNERPGLECFAHVVARHRGREARDSWQDSEGTGQWEVGAPLG